VIGVSSVVIMLGFGAGVQQNMKKQMSSLINNNITITSQGGYTRYTNQDVKGYVKAITLTPELAKEIEESFSLLSGLVTYGINTMASVGYKNNVSMSSFAGVPIDYLQKMEFTLDRGRMFNQ
jgi:ABC-type antimicrobial peptide transport system permease subunit